MIRTASQGTTPIADARQWDWTEQSACRGEDLVLFFGPDGERQPEREIRERKAKEICAACPVRTSCAEYAITKPERSGVWGGLGEDELAAERRRRLRKGLIPKKGKEGKQRPSRRITPPRQMEDGAGSARRLQAATVVGRMLKTFAREAGVSETTLSKIRSGAGRVSPGHAKAIADAYPKVLALAHQVHRVPLQTAARYGWHGPDAWTPDTIDDPAALPHVAERSAA